MLFVALAASGCSTAVAVLRGQKSRPDWVLAEYECEGSNPRMMVEMVWGGLDRERRVQLFIRDAPCGNEEIPFDRVAVYTLEPRARRCRRREGRSS